MIRIDFHILLCFFSRRDTYDAYMCKLGGTEKSQGKGLELIIHTFATLFKIPLEANDANKKGNGGKQEQCEQKVDSFSCPVGVRNEFVLL